MLTLLKPSFVVVPRTNLGLQLLDVRQWALLVGDTRVEGSVSDDGLPARPPVLGDWRELDFRRAGDRVSVPSSW